MTDRSESSTQHREDIVRRLGELDERTLALMRDITGLASRVAGTEFATITLADVDAMRVRACVSLQDHDLPHEETFCARTVTDDELVVVPDARNDARFRDLPLVQQEHGLRFYAGAPLRSREGVPFGTLCVLDRRPRDGLGELGDHGLQHLAQLAAAYLDNYLTLQDARRQRRLQAEQEQILDAFSRTSHSGYSLADANGVVRRISGFTSHILGYTPEELIGADVSRMVPEEYKGVVRSQYAAVVEDGKPRSGVWKVRHRNGHFRYMHIAGERVIGADGETLVFSSLTDVTHDHLRARLRNERSRLLERLARNRSVASVLSELLSTLPRYSSNAVAAIAELNGDGLSLLSAPELTDRQCDLFQELLRLPGSPAAIMRDRDWLTATPDLQQSSSYAGGSIAADAGWHAMIWFPLRHPDGSQRGAMAILRNQAEPFGDDETELLADVVALASTILETGTLLERMHYQASHDILTGLANRRLLKEHTTQALSTARRTRSQLAVCMLDLDNFKMVNDSMGHDAGDELLNEVADRLLACTREQDTVARLGGDEFVVVAPEVDRVGAKRLVDKLMEALADPVRLGERTVTVRPSIGIALSGVDGDSADALLSAADAAMYDAKASGRNTFRFHGPDMDRPIATRFQLQQELYQPEVRSQLATELDPRVDRQERLVAMEYISVWHHPVEGYIDRTQLLELAEETGQLHLMERLIVEKMAATLPTVLTRNPAAVLSVRLAEITLKDKTFPERLEQYMGAFRIGARQMEVDVTRAFLQHDPQLMQGIATLRERLPGLRLAMYDFGARAVPMIELTRLGVDTAKLAPEWLDLLTCNTASERHRAEAVITHLRGLCQDMGMTLVAEGVETPAQRDAAWGAGVHQCQGALFLEGVVREPDGTYG